LLICAGGTGGGAYPALAVHEALNMQRSSLNVLWVGGVEGMEASLVQRAEIPFTAIPAAGLHGVGLRAMPRNFALLARGFAASRKILREFRPDVLFFTGGYLAAPMALAGRKIPSLAFVPDIEPALALKSIAPLMDRIAVIGSDSKKFFSSRTRLIETGYPVRAGLFSGSPSEARLKLGLRTNKPVLTVWGGSRGARSINQALMQHLPRLLQLAQIVHISGELDWPQVQAARESLTTDQQRDYHAYPYMHEEMGAALVSADLVVSRAGASVLGEYPLLGLPSILVPYPHVWRYQKVNADALAKRGAAVVLEDGRLMQELAGLVESLLRDSQKLKSLSDAARALAQPDAARRIASQLFELAGEETL